MGVSGSAGYPRSRSRNQAWNVVGVLNVSGTEAIPQLRLLDKWNDDGIERENVAAQIAITGDLNSIASSISHATLYPGPNPRNLRRSGKTSGQRPNGIMYPSHTV